MENKNGCGPVVKLAINGCMGRMGRRLCALSSNDPQVRLVGAFTEDGDPCIGKKLAAVEPAVNPSCGVVVSTSIDEVLDKPDVMIDFSAPSATVERAREAVARGIRLVIGTTGLTGEQQGAIDAAAKGVAVIHAMNYSLGVNLLCKVVSDMTRALGEDFNIEITEAHHNRKVDAPSGTAYALADAVCAASGRTRDDIRHGREGICGARTKREIGMHSLRMGSVVGDHTVHFGSDFERLEVTHRAQDRDVFAAGAIRAAKYLACVEGVGMHTMADVLFKKK